ncbi:MAG: hypothetical protein QOH49_1760 [Acidobacteriota bacterium]|jgi:hypothetical protein|nr:hypothetical protein [Acidobacteriota bacterium]
MGDGEERAVKAFDPNATVAASTNARRPSEGATLAVAVAVAVALGIAFGVWINARLASAAAAGRAAHTRPAPDAPPPADETGTSQGLVETAAATAARTESAVTVVEGRTSKSAAAPVAREASRQSKADARPVATPEFDKRVSSEREQGRAGPCALYASAGSLTLRGVGAAPLVLGGPGEARRVMVNTPDWSNIAVLYEGRAGNGWSRYSVRSVSGRPGVYTVRFTTPCGSKTIPVTVTR